MVFWIAFAVSTVLVAGQIAFVLSFTPVVVGMAAAVGATLPPALRLASDLWPFGLFALLAIGDALVFALFAWFARRYWVGLLFVPSILYFAGAFGALWIFVAEIAALQ